MYIKNKTDLIRFINLRQVNLIVVLCLVEYSGKFNNLFNPTSILPVECAFGPEPLL